MTREIVDTLGAPGSESLGVSPFSQAVKAAGLIFVSGQGPIDVTTGRVAGSTIQEQTRQALHNVESILVAGGSSMEKVVSAMFLLKDPADFAGMNEEWVRWFPTDRPARSGARHPLDSDELLISIGVIAEA